MTNSMIPAAPEDLTSGWLTCALRSAGVLPSGSVASFEAHEIGQGSGFIGQTMRVKLTYEGVAHVEPSPRLHPPDGYPPERRGEPGRRGSKANAQRPTPAHGSPASLVAKFPSASATNREFGTQYHFYDSEIYFYREIAPLAPIRIPRCYYTGMDEATGSYLLLLEDLPQARAGDQIAGCTPDEAETIMRTLARFQAAWWDSPELD